MEYSPYPRRSERIRERLERIAANAQANENNAPDYAPTPVNRGRERRPGRGRERSQENDGADQTQSASSDRRGRPGQMALLPNPSVNLQTVQNASRNTAVPRNPPPGNVGILQRVRRELTLFMNDPPEGCGVTVANDNLLHWLATIMGPPDTPYEEGIFNLCVSFPPNYPFSAPRVYFLTKIYHCNINEAGYICIDILGANWSPALTIVKILLSIMSLLADPNPNDPLEAEIALLYTTDRARHDENARKWTARFARKKPEEVEKPVPNA